MSSAPAAMRFTFSKQERLNSEKIIARLYESGFVVSKYPLRVTALVLDRTELPEGIVAQAMINASKRKLKKAVHRNRMKRILRELYRHRKHQLYTLLEKEELGLAVSVIYSGTHVAEFWDLEKSFDKIWRKFFNELQVQVREYKVLKLNDGDAASIVKDEPLDTARRVLSSEVSSNSDNLKSEVLSSEVSLNSVNLNSEVLNSEVLNTDNLNSEVLNSEEGSKDSIVPNANEIGGGE